MNEISKTVGGYNFLVGLPTCKYIFNVSISKNVGGYNFLVGLPTCKYIFNVSISKTVGGYNLLVGLHVNLFSMCQVSCNNRLYSRSSSSQSSLAKIAVRRHTRRLACIRVLLLVDSPVLPSPPVPARNTTS